MKLWKLNYYGPDLKFDTKVIYAHNIIHAYEAFTAFCTEQNVTMFSYDVEAV